MCYYFILNRLIFTLKLVVYLSLENINYSKSILQQTDDALNNL